jgi:histidinol dehydrogenase
MKIINYSSNSAHIDKILTRGEKIDPTLSKKVKTIIENVRNDGDKALFAYTQQFDNFTHTAETVSAGKDYFEKCLKQTDPEFIAIIREAKANIEKYHSFQKQSSWLKKYADGVRLGQRIVPLDKVGVYVPGGEAFYPSTVLMNIIPAKIAGVKEIVVVTPPVHFLDKPELGATLALLGIEKVYLLGGAQAVAALAFGTQSIPRVDKIVGPGNIYVSLAKKEVFGFVDIDMTAGPSEVVVLAEQGVNPEWVALDLLSQAEHRTGFESVVLITDSRQLASEVNRAVEKHLKHAKYKKIITKILDNYGAIIVVDTLAEGAEIVNLIAPEHLELLVNDTESVLSKIKHAGAIFVGKYSSEPVGDYWAGPNHVLPTGGSARFFSPLGVYDFVKRSSLIYYTKKALLKHGPKINKLAQYEDLYFHGLAVMKRWEESSEK